MLAHPLQMKRIDYDYFDIFSRMLCEYMRTTCQFLRIFKQMLENGIQTYRSSYKRLVNFSVFNTNIAQSPRVSPNGIQYHIFHCASHISSSVMAEAVRQVATLAILVSQHNVFIHNAIVALQQDRERQQQEQVQCRRRRRRRQQSYWMRDWLLHGERLRHSHYYNLMESLQENDFGSELLAGYFD